MPVNVVVSHPYLAANESKEFAAVPSIDELQKAGGVHAVVGESIGVDRNLKEAHEALTKFTKVEFQINPAQLPPSYEHYGTLVVAIKNVKAITPPVPPVPPVPPHTPPAK